MQTKIQRKMGKIFMQSELSCSQNRGLSLAYKVTLICTFGKGSDG